MLFVGIKKDFNVVYKIEKLENTAIDFSILDSYDNEIRYCSFLSWGKTDRASAQLSFAILRTAGLSFKEAYYRHFEFLKKVISKKKKNFLFLQQWEVLSFIGKEVAYEKSMASLDEDRVVSFLKNHTKHFVSYFKLPIKDPRPALKEMELAWLKLKPGEKAIFHPPGSVKLRTEFLIVRKERNTFSVYFHTGRREPWKLIHDFYGFDAFRKISVFIEGMLNLMERSRKKKKSRVKHKFLIK